MTRIGSILFLCSTLGIRGAATTIPPEQIQFFEQHIRPFLANDCYECHGAKKQKGGLRVDFRDGLLKGGDSGPALVPGDAQNSLLIQAITHEDPDAKMPKDRPKLAGTVIANFVKWVNDGAPDPRDHPSTADAVAGTGWEGVFQARREWWSFQPLKKPPVPTVTNTAWSEQPVDRFILAKLEAKGIQPAPPASPNTWLRRVHFAITGLPPTPEELQSFLEDKSPDAQTRAVDRLLACPHFGERWARHWMDLIRFAETYGHEQDFNIPHVWQYRDYLIRAFNADVPYGQFVKEHVAGDRLPNPRRHPTAGFNESVIGTTWWYLHQATHAPVDPYQDEADRIDNQVDVFSKTFLGLTVACARCHDHKFDPISTKDYYSLTAFLRSSRQDIAYLDPDGRLEKQADKLRQLHSEETKVLRAALKEARAAGGPMVAPYLLAANEVLHGPAKSTDRETNNRPDVVFEDFEAGTYGRWKVEGEAFGTEPAAGKHPNQQAVEGFQGKRLANSFTQGDAPKGALRSQSFHLGRPYIRFLLGGGIPSRKARFVLRIGDQEVREASGQNRERLEPGVWDVREFAGKEASLEIIDDDDTTWGHINVDHIVFTDSTNNIRLARPVAVVAAEQGLSAPLLERWVTELLSPATQKSSHPLQPWLAAVAREQKGKSDGILPGAQTSAAPVTDAGQSNAPVAPPVYEPFPFADFKAWFPSGQGFNHEVNSGGNWRVAGKEIEFLPAEVAHSGWFAAGLQGTLRSPTFTLTHTNIHLCLAGNGGQVRLIISRYGLREFNPLLFEKTMFDVNTDGQFTWRSISSDLHRHIGRPAYFEFIDGGNGYVALDRIVFSNSPQPPSESPFLEAAPAEESLTVQAHRIEAATQRALDSWLKKAPDTNSLALLSWLSQKGLLDWGDASRVITAIAERLEKSANGLPNPMRLLAMTDGSVEETRIFIRGDPKTRGAPVDRRFLEAVAGRTPLAITNGSGRIELAEAMLAENNPFLYRVIVNRVWAHLFGRGLVATVDNFGKMGQTPTHPELLDDLALTFRESGGSIKQLIRSLCLTRTYQMSSSPDDPVAETQDPDNEWLHRMRLRRLEGEAIRDNLLAVAGQLNRTQFGPSVPTYFTPFMGDRMWVKNANGSMDGDRRRSVYLETRRNFLSSMMLTFDLPLPDTTVGQRNSSNVPGQALVLMNDPFVKQQAEVWAKEIVRQSDLSLRERIERMFLRALARLPKPAELDQVIAFLKTQAANHRVDPDEIGQNQALWTDACHLVFMLKEFVYIP